MSTSGGSGAFDRARSYLLGTINETVSPRTPHRLDRMRCLLRELGDPQDAYPTLHIGGTSGKGSTCTLLAAALAASGRRTGLHTKPHLRSMTERARIDGVNVSEERFADLLDDMMPAIERTAARHERPTYYETLLALAFLHFARERVDVAVIEVGLGGKLDGTNVLHPRVSAITNVGLDHTDVLGDTLVQIAADKAGIAKRGVPLVTAAHDTGARRVIEERCAAVGAPFVYVPERVRIELRKEQPSAGQAFALVSAGGTYEIELPLLGDFQRENAAVAVAVLEELGDDLRPSTAQIERGMHGAQMAGRMEYLPGHPGLVFDVAHNPDKIAHLVASLRERFGQRRFAFVLAIGESKDARRILQVLAGVPASFVFTAFETPGRVAVKPTRLASMAQEFGMWGRSIGDPVEALTVARRNARSDEIVVVTGSTFVVAQLREWYLENAVAR